jgi:predicted glycoside hydrolase/deacetylase ChbG (UPF0249 family)
MKTYRPDVPDMATTPIIFCADDFGLNRPVNNGILALARQGRLSAASCMTTSAAFASDAPALAELTIGKGFHLNLTEAETGTRIALRLRELIRRCYLHNIDVAQLRAGIEEQCDAFEQAFGAAPDYVDGHQHVHQLPVVREQLLQILQRRYGRRKPWVRSTRAPRGIAPFGDRFKAWIIETLGSRELYRQARNAGFRSSRHLLGVYDFSGDAARYLQKLDAWLAQAARGDVLMCHPASGAERDDAIGAQREVEFAALSDPALTAMLATHKVRIASDAAGIGR